MSDSNIKKSIELYNEGLAFGKKKDFKSAEELYLKAIELNSEFFQAHYNLGNIKKNSGKLNEAINYFQKSIEIKSDFINGYYNLGNTLKMLGKLDEAKKNFDKVLELNPKLEEAKENLQMIIYQKKIALFLRQRKKEKLNIDFKKKFSNNPFITHRNPGKDLINLLYKINSTELNKTKGGPLYGNGKTSDYQIFDNDNPILNEVKNDIIKIIKDETKANVFIIDSFFNILGAGGGSAPHHHLNSIDKNFKLDQQKYSLTYYLDVGDQKCSEPGYFVMQDPDEKVLPTNGMIMVIPASRKHSAVYSGKSDRLMIGVNFYCY